MWAWTPPSGSWKRYAIRTPPDELHDALQRELLKILDTGDRTLHTRPGEVAVWLVTGVNGVGKTTSIAKLGRRLKDDGHSVVLAAGDTFRAAAIEQLGTWAGRLDIHMVKHAPGADPGAVVFDAIEHAKAKKVDVVIVDTAGRLQTKTNLMEELKKVKRIADRETGAVTEVLLVLDATVGQNGLAQAKAFQEAVGATGVILTKLDGDRQGRNRNRDPGQAGHPGESRGRGRRHRRPGDLRPRGVCRGDAGIARVPPGDQTNP